MNEDDSLYSYQKKLLKWAREQREKRTATAKIYRRFLAEEEYVKSFEERGESVPPFIVFQPHTERDGVKGYMVPCSADNPDAELQDD